MTIRNEIHRPFARSLRWLLPAAVLALGSLAGAAAHAADLVVSAAASLTNAFGEIGKEYEKLRPGTRVLFNFGASGALLQQISRGAPVDVFASADLETMDRAESQNLVLRTSRANFAANKLVLVMPADSMLPVGKLQDLLRPEVQRIALGNPASVPVGRYAKAAMEKAGIWVPLQPKFVYTQNVRQSLDYVFRAEVEAGFVYATDVAVSPVKLRTVAEVATENSILYPIAVVKGYGSERRAQDFIDFVRSADGKRILEKYGFLQP
jgi:molybdate transport system substrate-binding protein